MRTSHQFALIANCFFAPLMLKENFHKRDLFGVALSILGAVTVVLSANPSDTRLTPAGLLEAIKQPIFIVLTSVYVSGVIMLVWLSSQKIGREHVFVDVGACALFGGFTVLSTKAFSSMLTLEWWGVVSEWITYPILVVSVLLHKPLTSSTICPGSYWHRGRADHLPEQSIDEVRQQDRHSYAICALQPFSNCWFGGTIWRLPQHDPPPVGEHHLWSACHDDDDPFSRSPLGTVVERHSPGCSY